MADPVFVTDGSRFVPQSLARGPWDPNALHGGAPAALLARAVEAVDPTAMHVARMTIEFLRPVPMAPLTVATEVVRPGKRVQLVGATIEADGTPVVRATALRIRTTELDFDLPETAADGPLGPEAGAPPEAPPRFDDMFGAAFEFRVVGGAFFGGPVTVWMRLGAPIVDSESPSPLMRVAACADFGNGISRVLDFERFLFINADLTVYLHRPPAGEWVCLDAVTWPSTAGLGLAESALYDERGRIGRSLQALFIDRR